MAFEVAGNSWMLYCIRYPTGRLGMIAVYVFNDAVEKETKW
jgi:hypothetical protein